MECCDQSRCPYNIGSSLTRPSDETTGWYLVTLIITQHSSPSLEKVHATILASLIACYFYVFIMYVLYLRSSGVDRVPCARGLLVEAKLAFALGRPVATPGTRASRDGARHIATVALHTRVTCVPAHRRGVQKARRGVVGLRGRGRQPAKIVEHDGARGDFEAQIVDRQRYTGCDARQVVFQTCQRRDGAIAYETCPQREADRAYDPQKAYLTDFVAQ